MNAAETRRTPVSEPSFATERQGAAGNTYDKYGTRNPVARLLVRRFLAEVEAIVMDVAPASVLDVGCGEGVVTERIAQLLPAARVVGLDVADPTLLDEWTARQGGNLRFTSGSAYSLPYSDDEFELLCAVEVLEHLEHPTRALAELARVSSRALLLSVPREPLWRVANVLSGRYVRDLGNTPGHVNHWSSSQFVRLVGTTGDIVRVRRPIPWTLVALRTV